MPFWDWWGPDEISGTPHSTRKSLARGSGRNDPFSTISDILGREAFPDDSKVYGHFNVTPRQAAQTSKKNFLAARLRGIIDRVNAPPTTADILAHLESLQDPSRYTSDQGSLARQAMQMASAQYDPLIAQLEAQMGSARNRANRNSAQLGNMYSSLSSDLQGDIPEIQQMYTEDKAESKQLYDQLQQQTQDQYAQSAAEQEEMMRRLNIEAAAPEALAGQQRDKDFFTQLAVRDAAVEQTALGKEERGAINYTQQGSQIARAEGTQRQADVMAQLSDLLAQYESQIGAQRAAKNSSYLSILGELTNDSQDDAVQKAQRDFENYISIMNLGRALDKDSRGETPGPVKSPADVAGRALSLGLDSNRAQSIQDIFMSAISSDPQILNGQSIFGQTATKETMASRVVEAGKRSGLSQADLNVLRTIALEYFGRR